MAIKLLASKSIIQAARAQPTGGSGGTGGTGGSAGGPAPDGRSDDCQRADRYFNCSTQTADYPICHCIVAATVCWGSSQAGDGAHCWAYSIKKQGVAIHGEPEPLFCELNSDTVNCAEADAALARECGCD